MYPCLVIQKFHAKDNVQYKNVFNIDNMNNMNEVATAKAENEAMFHNIYVTIEGQDTKYMQSNKEMKQVEKNTCFFLVYLKKCHWRYPLKK